MTRSEEYDRMLEEAEHYRYPEDDKPVIHVVSEKYGVHFDVLKSGKLYVFLPHQCAEWDIVDGIVPEDAVNEFGLLDSAARPVTVVEALATVDAFIDELQQIRGCIALLPREPVKKELPEDSSQAI